MEESEYDKKRARTRELAEQFNEQGDPLGWFDTLYKESEGDAEKIPWADMEPNRFFRSWAESRDLKGEGRTALVVGCGLGDDAKFLHDLGFKVTAFDISPTAIEWAKRHCGDEDIRFETADLFDPPADWNYSSAGSGSTGGFDFVLEIYTIQPLPLEMRPKVIDSIAAFVGPGGNLVVVTHGRDDEEEVSEIPWPLSKADLSRFEENGLRQADFQEFLDQEDGKRRFVVEYERQA